MSQLGLAVSVALAMLVAEDATGLATGALVAHGALTPLLAGAAVFFGAWIGDLLLFVLGRYLRPLAKRWGWARRRLEDPRLAAATTRLEQRTWQVLLISRAIPGTRLPIYVAAGLTGTSARRFIGWSAFACAAWTPLLLVLGAGWASVLRTFFAGWSTAVVVGLAVVTLIGIGLLARVLFVFIRRLAPRWHHEWWPTWALYAPVVVWAVWLAIRHRSVRAALVVNPAMPDSGVVGESKAAVLSRLATAPVIPWCLLPAGAPESRVRRLELWLRADPERLTWPLILKPDVGERGAGVELITDRAQALAWCARFPQRAIAQAYHPGPVEVGIFWLRRPGTAGEILAITDKIFPVVTGDGQRSLATLITSHPRYQLQADIYLRRVGADASRIPALGEAVALGRTGNHAQGCLFRDGAHLLTPELTAAVNGWMQQVRGLNYGRFDVRACDYDALRAGRNLGIVELNGLTSEPTALYDPASSAWSAWWLLGRAWSAAWAIGAAEIRSGSKPPTLAGMWRRFRAGLKASAAHGSRSDSL